MCGFSGFIKNIPNRDNKKIILNMCGSISHRGPDNLDYWEDDNIILGHNRLAIQDLSINGNQPFSSNCGRYIIVFNGEIYNHLELRKLYLSTFDFKSSSDTETLIELISRLGIEKSISLIDGMFSFAIYDRKDLCISLVRDRLGEKPLYYGIINNNFFFSSQLKAIKEINDLKFEINKESLNYYFNYCYIPSPLSIYKNISKLEPGSYISFFIQKSDKLKVTNVIKKTFWSPLLSRTINPNFIDSKDIEAILQNSVERQLISDVDIGAFLSGGIDSSLVTILASKVLKKKLNTFTISFPEKEYDESTYAREVAEYIGSNHKEIKISKENIFETIKNLSSCYDEPFADASQVPTMLLSRETSKYVKVALSGDGGDELFCGYNRYFWGDLIWSKINWINPNIRKLIANNLNLIPIYYWKIFFKIFNSISFNKFKVPNSEIKIKKIINRMMNVNDFDELFLSLIQISQSKSVLEEENIKKSDFFDLYKNNHELMSLDTKRRYMTFDMMTYLPDDILVKVDRAAMFYSLETRCPFLSKDVVESSFRLNNSNLHKEHKGKIVLKEILSKHMSSKFLNRPKTGFGIPIGEYIKKDLKHWADKYLTKEICENYGFINFEKIRSLKNLHYKGYDQTEILWQTIIFHSWAEKNL